jgi:hypothetical protein
LIRGSVSLSSPIRPKLAPLESSALADSGAVHLCIPEHLAILLRLAELERRQVLLGAIPMEDTDLVPRPQLQSLDVNPKSPNIPISGAKCASEYIQVVDEDMQAIASKGMD